jgi:hypothetical protein
VTVSSRRQHGGKRNMAGINKKKTTALSAAKVVFPLDMELLSRETLLLHTILIHFLEKIQFYHIISSTLISFYF